MPVLQDGQRHKEKPAEYLIELFMLKTFTSQRVRSRKLFFCFITL